MSDSQPPLDATAHVELVASGTATPIELVEAALRRIADGNAKLNAVVVDLGDKAATSVPPAGPVQGVPVLVKDACATAGDPAWHGMGLLRDVGWRDAEDQSSVRRLRAAGGVICGKTNMCELGTSVTTEPMAFGPTRNPWDLDRSPGGSSGGSAAAVAAGMVPVAQGTDAGGSVRIPAARCGIVGLKPSRGRISQGPLSGDHMAGLYTEGILSRSVRDAALFLDVLHGPDSGDPHASPPPRRRYVDEVSAEPRQVRIGVLTDVPGRRRPLHGDCVDAVNQAAALLEVLGHRVSDDAPSALHDGTLGAEGPKLYWAAYAGLIAGWERTLRRTIGPDDVEPLTWAFVERGRRLTAVEYVAAHDALAAMGRAIGRWHADGFDLLLLATTAEPPPPLGAWVSPADDPLRAAREGMATSQLNSVANHTGQPAISLPLGRSSEGLPLGVQLLAPYGREDVLLGVAAQLERASRDPAHPPEWAEV